MRPCTHQAGESKEPVQNNRGLASLASLGQSVNKNRHIAGRAQKFPGECCVLTNPF